MLGKLTNSVCLLKFFLTCSSCIIDSLMLFLYVFKVFFEPEMFYIIIVAPIEM